MIKFRTVELTYAAMFAALMAIGANITSWLPFLQIAGVPLSMQPFFAILAGLLLGSRLGAFSVIVYIFIGLVGMPVFAQFGSGFGTFLAPAGGFLISFIFTAYVVGKIIEKNTPSSITFIVAALVGITIIYVIGTNYMYFIVNYYIGADMSYTKAWISMMLFTLKDVIFTLIAASIAPKLYLVVKKGR